MRRAVIYPTLWQPVLTAGVPRDYAIAALMVSAVGMALTNSRWVALGMFALLWVVGWFFARIDPEFFSVYLTRLKLGRTKGSEGGNVYHS